MRLCSILTLITLAIVLGLRGIEAASGTTAVNRTSDPVILTGAQLGSFASTPGDDLFVYVYRGSAWSQIRFQVDERNSDGAYVSPEDGTLDPNDEVVFMAKDAGDQAPAGAIPNNGAGGITTWFEVIVTDPIEAGARAYAYVVRSSSLGTTFTGDYVSFNTTTHRLTGETYQFGFATPDPWLDTIILGSGPDILDRAAKIRLCTGPNFCPVREEQLNDQQDDVIKDGPVRAIIRGGNFIAYGSLVQSALAVDLSTIDVNVGYVRFSTDFNENAIGSTLYSAAATGGVTVDGTPDTLPATPFSPWWQLSTPTGSLIQVSDVSELAGTPENYYRDDSANDPFDTGDRRHYGDIGIGIADPAEVFTYRFAIYALPDRQSNVGETYAERFRRPLTATATLRPAGDINVYIPLLLK